ncbi:hypothetical protein HanIR_Chr13g0620161 [Helianthus annuus]|nr:hypothetical protein HanIR_Chr13g0620161 [Helianthus annuus]
MAMRSGSPLKRRAGCGYMNHRGLVGKTSLGSLTLNHQCLSSQAVCIPYDR